MLGRRKSKKYKPEHIERKALRQKNKIAISKNEISHPSELSFSATPDYKQQPNYSLKNKNENFF